jgi:hypothetical protein
MIFDPLNLPFLIKGKEAGEQFAKQLCIAFVPML